MPRKSWPPIIGLLSAALESFVDTSTIEQVREREDAERDELLDLAASYGE
jgi:hypothetical protein